MTPINPGQLKALNTLVSKLRIDKPTKTIMVQGFSGGRCESSTALYMDEAIAMIKHLKSLEPKDAAADKMRKKIISLAHEMGWRVAGTSRADMKRIDQWCRVFGYKHKSLDNHTYQELPKLVSQFEGAYRHFLKTL